MKVPPVLYEQPGRLRPGMFGGSMAHSPHKNWKGCRLCKPHKLRANGRAVRDPWAALRKIGKRRRVSRGDLGDYGDC